MRHRTWWLAGATTGLAAAFAGVAATMVGGVIAGRSSSILTDVGAAAFPHLLRSLTRMSPAEAYLTLHTVMYVVAGIAALAFSRLLDRAPAVSTALVFIVVIVELGFLMMTRATRELGRVDETTWRVLLTSHAVADVVFALGVLLAHPSIRRDLVRGYEE